MSVDDGYTRIDYGLRIDCDKNGCLTPHGDNGEVIGIPSREVGRRTTTEDGHATTTVRRVVIVPAWEPL